MQPSGLNYLNADNILALITSLFICCNPIAWALYFIPGGLISIIGFIWIIYLFTRLYFHKSVVSISVISLSLIIILIFIFDFIFGTTGKYYWTYLIGFMGFGILGLQLGYCVKDIKRIISYVAWIGVILAPFIFTLDMGKTDTGGDDYGRWMGVSYGILRFIIALIIYLCCYKPKKITKIIFSLFLLGYSVFYLIFASRGAILAIGLLGLFIWIGNSSKNQSEIIWKLCLITIFAIGCGLLFKEIIIVCVNIVESFGIDTFSFEKMLMLIETNDLSNGRSALYEDAMMGISNSPLFGNGIATFEKIHQIYIHNLFLQIWYELGVIPTILSLMLLGYSLYLIFNIQTKIHIKVFLEFILCAGIVELIFSSSFWISHQFWIWIGFSIRLILLRHKVATNNHIKISFNEYPKSLILP